VKYILAIIVIIYLALATLYSAMIPLGEGPDEPGHAAYVFFLAREGRLPIQRGEKSESDVPGEGHQPPLAYLLAAPMTLWLPREERRFDLPGNPRFTWAGGNELNAVAHGTREHWPWRGVVLAWHLARLVPVALGAVTVVMTFLIAHEVCWRLEIGDWRLSQETAQSPISNLQSPIPLLAAALVAFNPQFLFTSALITNDALLVTLSAVLLWLVVRGQGSGVRGQGSGVGGREIAIGVVLGLTLLTKQSALLLVPVALLGVMRRWPAVGTGHWGKKLLVSLFPCLLVITIAAIVSGWWYARNWRLYGDPFALEVFQAEFATQPFEVTSVTAWIGALTQLHNSFWARFGWMNIPAPNWVIGISVIVEVVALVGLVARSQGSGVRGQGSGVRGQEATNDERRTTDNGQRTTDNGQRTTDDGQRTTNDERRTTVNGQRTTDDGQRSTDDGQRTTDNGQRTTDNGQRTTNDERRTTNDVTRILASWHLGILASWSLILLIIMSFAWVISFALAAGLVAWQGRFLFPALPAIATFMALGLTTFIKAKGKKQKPNNYALFTLYLVPCTFAVIAFWLPFGVIRPAYPFYPVPETVALEQIGTPVYGRFGKAGELGAELRGWRSAGEPRPGATLDLTLTWHALARQNRDWTVFVHLVDQQEQIVAEDNRQPLDGAFPMTQWVAGDWIKSRHRLQLPANLAPGTYTLRVGLFDPADNGRRAGRFDEDGDLKGDSLDIGQIVVSGQPSAVSRQPSVVRHDS
jgi:hypothetical protein